MSAWMVSKKHIDAIISTALYGPADSAAARGSWNPPYTSKGAFNSQGADDAGLMLIEENVRSIHARYPDTIQRPDRIPGPNEPYWLTPYTFPDPFPTQRLSLAVALKAIDCYQYQSCEHDAWETSDARKFTDALRNRLITCLPGYDAAPWGID